MVVSETNIHSIHYVTLLFLFSNEWNGCLSHYQCHISPLCQSFIATLQLVLLDCQFVPKQHNKMLEQTCITCSEVCVIIHQGLENIETFSSRPRPRLFLQDQDQNQDFYFKTKTIFHVLEVPRDQDQGLEITSLVNS